MLSVLKKSISQRPFHNFSRIHYAAVTVLQSSVIHAAASSILHTASVIPKKYRSDLNTIASQYILNSVAIQYRSLLQYRIRINNPIS